VPTAYVTRPYLRLPEHKVTTDEIIDDIRKHHSGHPQLKVIERVIRGAGVETRHFTRPLASPVVSGGARLDERNTAAYADALAQAVHAANGALEEAGLTPGDVDAVITSHTTSWASPALDIDLVNHLGLRPDVRRIPMSTLGCVGGAHALTRAHSHIAAHPGSRVLVVVAETLSTVYNHRDTTLESMIYKVLFGDSAAAAVVTDTPLGPGMAITDTWEYVLPHSTDRYRGRLDLEGLHFDSTPQALNGTSDIMPALHAWIARTAGEPWTPAWVVVHPGGPRILHDAARGLGLDTHRDLKHSWDSLRHCGNLGGAAVLDVLARTHSAPPPNDSPGLLLAFGPGFTVTAAHGTWYTP